MKIAIDFDGTCVTHEFPKVGKDIGAANVLKTLVKHGHQLILFTMRSDRREVGGVKDDTIQDVSGDFLQDAIGWFKKNDIPLYGIQKDPTQSSWTTSPKAYAHIYIDDAALGTPLVHNRNESDRPYVDWESMIALLVHRLKIPAREFYENY